MNRDRHEARVAEVANRYRELGYDVVQNPVAADRPGFLGDFEPDLLALREGDNVIVEVRESLAPDEADRLAEVAEVVGAESDWRFDLYLPERPRPAVEGADGRPLLPLEDVQRRLEEAESLLNEGHAEAALLLAWTATEGWLRLAAQKEETRLPRGTTAELVKQLVFRGVISREQYERLRAAMLQRNVVVHGFGSADAEPAAREVISLGRELLRDVDRAA